MKTACSSAAAAKGSAAAGADTSDCLIAAAEQLFAAHVHQRLRAGDCRSSGSELVPAFVRPALAEVFWRFHFMLGTIYYSVASPQRIKTFSKGRCDPGNLEDTLRHLIPFSRCRVPGTGAANRLAAA